MSRRSLGVLAALLVGFAIAAVAASPEPSSKTPHVLFVCEHGNVKSLMAAQYFTRLAAARGLRLDGVARGTAPNSSTVPPPIVAGLRTEGYDVAAFTPRAVSPADAAGAVRVIAIGAEVPPEVAAAAPALERWDDVPAASEDFAAARAALLRHLDALIESLRAR